jgi:UDP-glucose 4-epimerase
MVDNIKMVSNVAKILAKCSPRSFIYLSSIDVYGRENLSSPLHELSNIMPWNYYTVSKITGEYIFKLACINNHVPLSILRLPGVYGPADTHRSPIATFITYVLNQKPITIRGTGSEKRDFLYVKDISTIIRHIILKRISGTFNIVTGQSYTINEVLNIIRRLSGCPFDIMYEHGNKGIDLLFKKSALLNIIPEFNFTKLETGLKETYEYYKKNITHRINHIEEKTVCEII